MKLLVFYHVLTATIAFAEIKTPNKTVGFTKDEIQQFLSILPKEKMHQIAQQHLKTDEGFKAAVKYMQMGEFAKLLDTIRAKPEWARFRNYLKLLNVDIDGIFKCVRGFLANATVEGETKGPKSLRLFVQDVQENIPREKLLTFMQKKMADPGFQQLYDQISSPQSKEIVESVLRVPEVKTVINMLEEMDLGVKRVFYFVYTFLGWGNFEMSKV